MNQIQNLFGSLEIGIWILFVICYLVLGIFSIQGLNCTWLSYKTFSMYFWDTTIETVSKLFGDASSKKRDLCTTTLSDHYELFGVPIRAKRTAHVSGQILNCLRSLGRV